MADADAFMKGLLAESPFSKEIMVEKIPEHFSRPQFVYYDGTLDPFDHILHHRTLSITCIPTERMDSMLCQVFASSLIGPALSWFSTLKPNSISSFFDLGEAFLLQFACSKRFVKEPHDLFSIKQGRDESLKEYIKRFARERIQVVNCHELMVTTAFRMGLLPSTLLYDSFAMSMPFTMEEAISRAHRYIEVHDLQVSSVLRSVGCVWSLLLIMMNMRWALL